VILSVIHLEQDDRGGEFVNRMDWGALNVDLLFLRVGPNEVVEVSGLEFVGLLGQQLAVRNSIQ
jgi:hypothetical protein